MQEILTLFKLAAGVIFPARPSSLFITLQNIQKEYKLPLLEPALYSLLGGPQPVSATLCICCVCRRYWARQGNCRRPKWSFFCVCLRDEKSSTQLIYLFSWFINGRYIDPACFHIEQISAYPTHAMISPSFQRTLYKTPLWIVYSISEEVVQTITAPFNLGEILLLFEASNGNPSFF